MVQVILRGVQLFLTVLITALVGNVIAEAFAGNAAAINYAIFVAAFSWVVLLFGGVAAFVTSLAIPVVLIVLDGLATLLTFIAGVVLAARLGVHSCGNVVSCAVFIGLEDDTDFFEQAYIRSNNLTNGSNNPGKRCRELQASTAFFWFLFAAYAASTAMTVMAGGSSSIRGGGIRKGGQSMSQV